MYFVENRPNRLNLRDYGVKYLAGTRPNPVQIMNNPRDYGVNSATTNVRHWHTLWLLKLLCSISTATPTTMLSRTIWTRKFITVTTLKKSLQLYRSCIRLYKIFCLEISTPSRLYTKKQHWPRRFFFVHNIPEKE
jgi:hypothetical protein